jgi:NOL1/NOP2/fmu family ribosome biogenesis protein
MSGTEKTIDQFAGWEDTSQQHDFFGETNLEVDVVEIASKDDVKSEDTLAKEKEEKEEQELIDDQFSSFEKTSKVATEDDDEDDKVTPSGKKEPVTNVNNKQTLEFLKEKGLVDYELEDGKELSEEEAEHLIEDSWEKALEAEVESTIKDLPQDIKDLIKFASKGGNVGDLLSKMVQHATSGITKNSDIENEDVQVLAITMDLKNQGYDQEYIDSQVEFLKDSGKLGNISKKSFDKIIAGQEAETAGQVERQKESVEFRKKQAREYKTNITTHINSLNEMGGLPISKQDKTVLPTYISEPTVELQDGRYVSEMQADLFKVMADKDKIVLLAKLLKTDFDFSAIERRKQTQAARGIKEAVERVDRKEMSNSESGGHKSNKKALWDMLED